MTTDTIDPARIVHTELLPGARNWSFVVRRGFALRLTDRRGGANCSALFYNAQDRLERYNMADTLKAQHTAFLTQGHVSTRTWGASCVSIVDDSCGWHDTICGVSNAALVRERYGEARYQEHRNALHRNGRDSFLIELGKWGLGKRDLVANVNFFSKVVRGRRRAHGLRPRPLAARGQRGPALRDGHPGGALHLPASARPQPRVVPPRPIELTALAGPTRWPRTTPAA